MKFSVFLFIPFCFLVCTARAQNRPLTEDEDNLYWQPGVQIEFSHFQSESDADCIEFNKKYGVKMSPTVQIQGVVDIPKSHLSRKIKKRIGDDRAYLSPVFCKDCSCLLSEDSMELELTQLLFDVAEMCARGARIELLEIKEEMNSNNVNAMFFTTVRNSWEERMRGTWAAIYQDVLIQKEDSAFVQWRQLVDNFLSQNSDFATQPYEIKRLMLGEPIEENYVEPKSIMGDLRGSGEE